MQSRTYTVGLSSITLRFGDITESGAEALVSSDDYMLSMGVACRRRFALPAAPVWPAFYQPGRFGE